MMSYQSVREKDLARFHEAFQQRCDMSRLLDLNAWSYSKLSDRHELLGEGEHFTAWRLREPSDQQQTRHGLMPLVYKRSHQGFGGGGGSLRHRQWCAAMLRLQAPIEDQIALVSPMLVGPVSYGAASLLMPYGGKPLTAAAAHWLPLASLTSELRSGLHRLGLAWPDVIQGRCWDGIPFIFDWSDISLAPLIG